MKCAILDAKRSEHIINYDHSLHGLSKPVQRARLALNNHG